MVTADDTCSVGGSTTINIAYSDLAGNAGSAVVAASGSPVVVDTTAPTIPTATIASNNPTTTLAKAGDVITLSIASSEDLIGSTVLVTMKGGSACSVVNDATVATTSAWTMSCPQHTNITVIAVTITQTKTKT